MPTLQERNQVGKREDLADVIVNVDSQETPLFSLVKKGKKPTNTLCEWQVDDYRKGNRDGVTDGEDVKSFNNQSENRAMLQGRVQVFRETAGVGFIAEEVSNVAGVKSEYKESVRKALFVVRRTIEEQIGSDDDSRPDSGPQSPAKTRGLFSWTSPTPQSDLAVPELYRTPAAQIYSGALASMTEDHIAGVVNSIYLTTKQKKNLPFVVGIQLKKWFSDLTRYQSNVGATVANTRQFSKDASSKQIVATVDIWEGDGGTLEMIPSAFLRDGAGAAAQSRSGIILDPDYAEILPFQLPTIKPLQDQGGGPRGFVQAMVVMACTNPKPHGVIKGS